MQNDDRWDRCYFFLTAAGRLPALVDLGAAFFLTGGFALAAAFFLAGAFRFAATDFVVVFSADFFFGVALALSAFGFTLPLVDFVFVSPPKI